MEGEGIFLLRYSLKKSLIFVFAAGSHQIWTTSFTEWWIYLIEWSAGQQNDWTLKSVILTSAVLFYWEKIKSAQKQLMLHQALDALSPLLWGCDLSDLTDSQLEVDVVWEWSQCPNIPAMAGGRRLPQRSQPMPGKHHLQSGTGGEMHFALGLCFQWCFSV